MRRWRPTMLFCLVLATGMIAASSLTAAENDHRGKVLRHVVMFKLKEGTAATKVAEIEQAFAALPSKIDSIVDFEWGTDVSTEKLSQGFTHCFLVSFANEQGRAAYLPHPAHQAFVALLKPHVDKVLVVDYWANK